MESTVLGGQAVDASGIVGQAEGPFSVLYNSRDLLLYALGIGCTPAGADHGASSDEMRYLFEGHPDFCAFPTYPMALPFKGRSSDVVPFPGGWVGDACCAVVRTCTVPAHKNRCSAYPLWESSLPLLGCLFFVPAGTDCKYSHFL